MRTHKYKKFFQKKLFTEFCMRAFMTKKHIRDKAKIHLAIKLHFLQLPFFSQNVKLQTVLLKKLFTLAQ